MSVLGYIGATRESGKKMLAVLLDPERLPQAEVADRARLLNEARVDLVMVGGSRNVADMVGFIATLKRSLCEETPVLLFPGDLRQFAPNADALLFLSLLSGRNAEYLVGQQVRVAMQVKESGIETLPMGYILVDGGRKSAVECVSQTAPLCDEREVVATAVAAELMGKELVYLEAGSGAKTPISSALIAQVRAQIGVPLFVGGGICTVEQMNAAFKAGADVVVVGNHFEQCPEDIVVFGRNKWMNDGR